MAAGFVQAQSTSHLAGSASSGTVAYSPSNVAGNCLVLLVGIWMSTEQSVSTITDSAGNTGWIKVAGTAGNSTHIEMWVCPNCLGGANTITITLTGVAFWAAAAAEYSGVALNALLETQVAHVDGSAGTAHSSGNTGASFTGELVLGGYFDSVGADSPAPSDSKTARVTLSTGGALVLSDNTNGSAGVQSAAFSTSLSATGAECCVVLKLPAPPPSFIRPLIKIPLKVGPWARGPFGQRSPSPRVVKPPYTLLATSTGATPLRAPVSDKVAMLHDGSLLVGYYDGVTGQVKQVQLPDTHPIVVPATTVSYDQISIFTVPGAGTTDIWIASGSETIASGNNTQNQKLKHGTYDGSVFTWDTETLVPGTISAGRQQPSVTWTGTWLIVAWWDDTLGGNSDQVFLNWTTVKAGTSGWLGTALQMTTTAMNSVQATVRHSTKLAATVLVYCSQEKLFYRTLKDSAASPALANWKAETSIDATFDDACDKLGGPVVTIDEAAGLVHVARAVTTFAGSLYSGVYYWLGTPDAVPMSTGAITWNSRLRVDSDTPSATDPPDVAIGVDGQSSVWLFWITGVALGNIKYVKLASPYASSSSPVILPTLNPQPRSPHVPSQAPLLAGYVPLVYSDQSTTPTEVVLDTSLIAPAIAITSLFASGASVATGTADTGALAALSAAGAASTTGSDELDMVAALAATGSATSTGSADLAEIELTAAAGASTSSGAAAIGVLAALTAAGASATTGSADAGAVHPLAASGASASTGTADVGTLDALAAAGTATSAGATGIVVVKLLAASGSSTSSGSAAVGTLDALAASGASSSTGTGDVLIVKLLAAAGNSTSAGAALVVAMAVFASAGSSASAGAAQMVLLAQLVAAGGSLSSGSGEQVSLEALAASGASSAAGSAALTLTGLLAASGIIASTGASAIGMLAALSSAGAASTAGGAAAGTLLALSAMGGALSAGTADIADVSGAVTLDLAAAGQAATSGSAGIAEVAALASAGAGSSAGLAQIATLAPLGAAGGSVSSGAVGLGAIDSLAATGAAMAGGGASIGSIAVLGATGSSVATGASGIGDLAQLGASGGGLSSGVGFAGLLASPDASGGSSSAGAGALLWIASLVASGGSHGAGAGSLRGLLAVAASGGATAVGTGLLTATLLLRADGIAMSDGVALLILVAPGTRLRRRAGSRGQATSFDSPQAPARASSRRAAIENPRTAVEGSDG